MVNVYSPLDGSGRPAVKRSAQIVFILCACAVLALTSISSLSRKAIELESVSAVGVARGIESGVDCTLALGVLSSVFCSSPARPTGSAVMKSAVHSALAASAEQAHLQQQRWRKDKEIDCSCCKKECKKKGKIKVTVDGTTRIQKYWCVWTAKWRQPPPKCPVYDYNCICCDRVRDVLHGESCA